MVMSTIHPGARGLRRHDDRSHGRENSNFTTTSSRQILTTLTGEAATRLDLVEEDVDEDVPVA